MGRIGGRASRSLRGAHLRLRRDRFRELVERQLDLFAADEADLLGEAADAELAWVQTGRDSAEEAYGDYQLVVDAIADRLLELRDAYAATLDDDESEAYLRSFAVGARRRFRRHASIAADLEPDG